MDFLKLIVDKTKQWFFLIYLKLYENMNTDKTQHAIGGDKWKDIWKRNATNQNKEK